MDSPPSFPPGAQVESQSVQEPEDPPITDQDPVSEVPQAAVAQVTEDPSSEATAVQDSDSEVTAIQDIDSQATEFTLAEDPTLPAETDPSTSTPPPPVITRTLGFHTPDFVRHTSGRTRRVSYRPSSRVSESQVIVCSSDSDE